MTDKRDVTALPLELTPGSHVCWVDEDPDDGTPAHYRPCPPGLCEAARLHNLIVGLRQELLARRACLEGARDDLARISTASVEDGGIWVRAVAEARLPLVDAAIRETNEALNVVGDFNVCV